MTDTDKDKLIANLREQLARWCEVGMRHYPVDWACDGRPEMVIGNIVEWHVSRYDKLKREYDEISRELDSQWAKRKHRDD